MADASPNGGHNEDARPNNGHNNGLTQHKQTLSEMSFQESKAAKAQEKKTATATLANNITWVLSNGAPFLNEKKESEYRKMCLYVGRLAAQRLAVSVTQEDLLTSLTKDGYKKVDVSTGKGLRPLTTIMMNELSPLLEEKEDAKTAITLCYSQVEACPLPPLEILKNKAPAYISFMEGLHGPGSLFRDLPELSHQCLRTVAGLKLPLFEHDAPYENGAIHQTPKQRSFQQVKKATSLGFILFPPHLDYEPKQVERIVTGTDYKGKPTRHPLFIVMPLERPVSLLVYGNGIQPNQDNKAYLGKLETIQVGEMLICAFNLWHCTGPPVPLAKHPLHGYLSYQDTRIHACFGFTREDIDETNLQPPDGERIWKTVLECVMGCDLKEYSAQYAMLLREEQENKRKRKKQEPMVLRKCQNKEDPDLLDQAY